MNEKDITFIVATTLLFILIVISIVNKYLRKETNQHLKTFNDDLELYSYKVKKDIIYPKNDKPDLYISASNHIDNINILNTSDIDLEKYSKSDLENTDTWIKMRTSYTKDFILHKINEINNNSYNNYFAIKDIKANKIIKERYLNNDTQTEIENINNIKRFITNKNVSDYEVLYIGSFGFISNSISTIFDIK
jgi:hypothetical protein